MTNKIYQDVEVKGKLSATGQISGASLNVTGEINGASLNVTGEINGANLSSALLATLRDYFLPVGSRVKQGEQTPAAKFGGTWVVDTDYTGRTEIGSGTGYELGAIGGSADAVMIEHFHQIRIMATNTTSVTGNSQYVKSGENSLEGSTPTYGVDESSLNNTTLVQSGIGKNMPPYKVVTVWKRTA